METSRALAEALGEAQRLGMLGDRPIDAVIEHARAFVDAVVDVDGTVLDLGSGGGVPGLVIAHDRADLRVVLLDRRTKRTDFLARQVRRLHWSERVEVLAMDVEVLAASVRRGDTAPFDAVVARGFGPPDLTLETAISLTRSGGVVAISEPPAGDRWSNSPLVRSGSVQVERHVDGVARFVVGTV